MLEHSLVVGRVYRFTFKSDFEAHGVCSTEGVKCLHQGGGVFRIEQIASYNDIILAGVDLYSSFFKPLGFTRDQYNAYYSSKPASEYAKEYEAQDVVDEKAVDVTLAKESVDATGNPIIVPVTVTRKQVSSHVEMVETGKSILKRKYLNRLNFKDYPIYKLVDVLDDTDVIYAPELSIKGFPEVGIYHYRDVNLNIHIGYWEDPSELEAMMHSVRERLTAYGVHPLSIDLFTTDHRWMTKDEYAKIKTLNVPGTEVTVTEDNKDDYIDEHAIIDGEFKLIVDKSLSAVRDGEVSIQSLLKKKQVIDPQVFLRQVNKDKDGIFFKSGLQYYRKENLEISGKTVSVFRKLIPDQHYVVGQAFTEYAYVFTKYTGVRDVNDQYYVIRPTFRQTTDTVAVAGKEYFSRVGNTFTKVTVATGGDVTDMYECISGADEYVSATTAEIQNTATVLYKRTATTTAAISEFYVMDYGSDEAVDLIGKAFTYTNRYNVLKTQDLGAQDVLSLSVARTSVAFPKCVVSKLDTNDTPFDRVVKQYAGRWFQFNYENRVADGGITSPIGCVVSDENRSILAGQSGTIYGEEGEVWKLTYIADDSQKRNYYALYTKALQTMNIVQDRNVQLEKLVAKLNQELSNYR